MPSWKTSPRPRSVDLGAALAASADALAGLNAAGLGDRRMAARAADRVEMLALSVGDAIEVNWRIGADQLDIPLNPAIGGKLMVARPDPPIPLGRARSPCSARPPSSSKKLLEEWIAWLNENSG